MKTEDKISRQISELADKKAIPELKLLFKAFPAEQADHLRPVRKRDGDVLVTPGEAVNLIYILIKGRVDGVMEQAEGNIYRYARFQPPSIFGEMETFSGSLTYRSTLICSGDCIFLTLPKDIYFYWMRRDADTLFYRTQSMVTALCEQTRNERNRSFSSGLERLILCLVGCCHRTGSEDGRYVLTESIQELADSMGCSTKTVQRGLAKLMDEELLIRSGHRLIITNRQLEQLLKHIRTA